MKNIDVDKVPSEKLRAVAAKYNIHYCHWIENKKGLYTTNAKELVNFIDKFAAKHKQSLSNIRVGFEDEILYLGYFKEKTEDELRAELKDCIEKRKVDRMRKADKIRQRKLKQFEKLKKELGKE